MKEELFKQLGPVPEYPEEPNKSRKFVLQAHARGKSIHFDLRFSLGDVAEGWTISVANPDAVPWPVLTLAQLRELLEDQNVWKIDLETGLIFPRKVKTTIKGKERIVVRPGSLFAERKAQIIPKEWLSVEGRTGWPPDWPKTILQTWSSLPDYARQELRREGFDPGWAEEALKKKTWEVKDVPVGATRAYPGVFLIVDEGLFTFGARKVWFYEYFIEEGKLLPERVAFRLVARARTIEKAMWFQKFGAIVLPEGVEDPVAREPGYWIFTTPDPWPYVLSEEAVDEGWLPPKGVAALPQRIIKAARPETRYWEKKDEKERLEARRLLIEELKEPVKEEGIEKSETEKIAFRLFRQTFKGQEVVRFGPSTTIFWVVLRDLGYVFALDNDPRIRESVAGLEMENKYNDALWGIEHEEPEPGTLLNPTKETPSTIERIDEGEAKVMEQEPGFLKLELDGEELSGYFVIAWENPDSPIIVFRRSNLPEVKKAEDIAREWRPIAKSNEKQIAYGIVLSPYGPDGHGHIISEEEIEKAAHRYMVMGREIGLFHEGEPIAAYPVESYIARTDFLMNENDQESLVRKGEWVLGVWIVDPEVWKLFTSGTVRGFSIKGICVLERVDNP